MPATRKQFLQELIKLHDPNLANTDIDDVARALNLPLAAAKGLVQSLVEGGHVQVIGLGGNLAPTAKGLAAANDPDLA